MIRLRGSLIPLSRARASAGRHQPLHNDVPPGPRATPVGAAAEGGPVRALARARARGAHRAGRLAVAAGRLLVRGAQQGRVAQVERGQLVLQAQQRVFHARPGPPVRARQRAA